MHQIIILNGNDSEFESSDDSDDELEDTDFDNAEPKLINIIIDETKAANSCVDDSDSSTESDGDTPEHPVCNKKTRVYKWVNKPFESTAKTFDPPLPMPPPKEVNATPYKYILEFVDAAMIENTSQTNLYYLQKTGNSGDFTISEVQQFLGIYLLMDIVKMPSVRTYWENGARFSDIADVMSRN